MVELALISGLWLQYVTLSHGCRLLPGFAGTSTGRSHGRAGIRRGWPAGLEMGFVEDSGAIKQGGVAAFGRGPRGAPRAPALLVFARKTPWSGPPVPSQY